MTRKAYGADGKWMTSVEAALPHRTLAYVAIETFAQFCSQL